MSAVQNQMVEEVMNEGVQTPAQEAAETAAKATKKEKVKLPKWYEVEGAVNLEKGDVVRVVSGDSLVNRKAVFDSPSEKEGKIRVTLIHPVSETLQKTLFTIELNRVEKIGKAAFNEDGKVSIISEV